MFHLPVPGNPDKLPSGVNNITASPTPQGRESCNGGGAWVLWRCVVPSAVVSLFSR